MDNQAASAKQEKWSRRFSSIRTLADVRQSNDFFSKLVAFFHHTWLDWLTLAAVGILTAGVCALDHGAAFWTAVSFKKNSFHTDAD
jgi:hypothetical protein